MFLRWKRQDVQCEGQGEDKGYPKAADLQDWGKHGAIDHVR